MDDTVKYVRELPTYFIHVKMFYSSNYTYYRNFLSIFFPSPGLLASSFVLTQYY